MTLIIVLVIIIIMILLIVLWKQYKLHKRQGGFPTSLCRYLTNTTGYDCDKFTDIISEQFKVEEKLRTLKTRNPNNKYILENIDAIKKKDLYT